MKIYSRAMLLLAVLLGLTLTACEHAAQPQASAAAAAPPQPQGCVVATTSTIQSFAGANAVVPKIEVTNNCQAAVDVDLKFGLFWLRDGKQSFEWTDASFKDLRPGHTYEQEWFDHQFDKYLSTFRLTASSFAEITCQKGDSPDQCKTVLACEREQTVDFCERGYGSGGRPVEQASQVPASQSTSPVPPQMQPSDSPEESIRQLLELWEESFKTKDAARHADCYAPMIERYFLRSNITHDQLRRDKEQAFQTISEIRQYEIHDLAITPETAGGYSATFRKLWDTTGTDGKQFSGEDIQKLQFAVFNGEWKIVSETEPKVIHVIKGNIRR